MPPCQRPPAKRAPTPAATCPPTWPPMRPPLPQPRAKHTPKHTPIGRQPHKAVRWPLAKRPQSIRPDSLKTAKRPGANPDAWPLLSCTPALRALSGCRLPPRNTPCALNFAPALIAAKSLKPCDRGVFGGLKFAPENGAAPGLRAASGWRLRAGFWFSALEFSVWLRLRTLTQASRLPHALPPAARACGAAFPFAPDLIAAKPLKPCDRGVFGGLKFAPENGAEGAYRGRAAQRFCGHGPSLRQR